MSQTLSDEAALRGVYMAPGEGAVTKEIPVLDAHCRQFISLSPFLCIGSSRPDGLADVSPRGGEPGFVHVLSDTILAMPDRPGNNRLDTMSNIVEVPSVGLLFFIPGIDDCLRVNGVAEISVEPSLLDQFMERNRQPRSVMLIKVREVYLHCTKALKRADIWNPDKYVPRDALPTAGQIYRDHCKVEIPAEAIDTALETDAKDNLY